MCLPPFLRDLRQRLPAAVAIELVPSDSVENLLLREGRYRPCACSGPHWLELIAKKLWRPPSSPAAHRKLPILGAPAAFYQARPRNSSPTHLDRASTSRHYSSTAASADGLRPEKARRFHRAHRHLDRCVGADQGRPRHRLRAAAGWCARRAGPGASCLPADRARRRSRCG